MPKAHTSSPKYQSKYIWHLLSAEGAICAGSMLYGPALAPFTCSQFAKDVIYSGKQALVSKRIINNDGLVSQMIDESAETLAFFGSMHSLVGFSASGWSKVIGKTVAGLMHVLADKCYDIYYHNEALRDILAYSVTYDVQYTAQKIAEDSIFSALGQTGAKILGKSLSMAMGNTARDLYSHGEVKLPHSLNGLAKGILYGSKIPYHGFEYIADDTLAHYLDPLAIENIGVVLEHLI